MLNQNFGGMCAWTGTDVVTWTAEGARTDQTLDGPAICFGTSGNRWVTSPSYTGGMGTLTFNYVRGFTGGGARSIEVYVNGNKIGDTITVSSSSNDVVIYNENLNIAGNVILEIRSTGSAQVIVDEIEWTGYASASDDPELNVAPLNLNEFKYILGEGPSDSQQITVSGTKLKNKVTLTAPDNYEVSSDGSNYLGNISLENILNGELVDTVVYIRLKDDLVLNTYTGDLTVDSEDAATVTIPLTGYVIKPAPTQHVSNFQASVGAPPCSTIRVTWANPEGGYAPDNYLILASKISYEDITEPVDGISMVDSKYRVNASGTSMQADFNQLDPLTTYYFKIYPYNNSESDILYYIGGEVPQAEAQTSKEPETFIFWDFNDPPASNTNWDTPILSTNEIGSLTYTFTQAYSFAGTTTNGLAGTGAGGSFAPRGGPNAENNDKYFILSIPTTGYANIGLSYAIQRTGTGFTSNKIEYSVDGGASYEVHSTLTDIPTSFAIRSFDFSDITEANNNPNFEVKITLDGASSESGNNRFDNIRITGSEVCAYPTDVPITIDDFGTITFTGGSANISTATMPDMPNPNITAGDYEGLALGLIGNGPWAIEIVSTFDHCAYNWQGGWHDATVGANGFEIGIASIAKGSNNLFIVLSDQDPTLPVELSSFMVALNSSGMPVVTWETQTETGVNGFYIYRGVNKNINEAILVSSLINATNTSIAQSYSFVDTELIEEGTYYYWLNVSDLSGHESYHGPAELNFTFGEEEDIPEVVYTTALRGIYPNPFNPNANIGFELAEKSEVKISVYNSRGQLVRSFAPFTHDVGQGSIVWDGKDEGGSSVSSGIYLFRMMVGAKSYSAKALMIK